MQGINDRRKKHARGKEPELGWPAVSGEIPGRVGNCVGIDAITASKRCLSPFHLT
jgi:hypothetical protein